jgi:uncharacterized tellurite resistance protein B-like protein
MIKAEDAKALYNQNWAIKDPTLEELSKYLEDGARLGRYEFVATFDSTAARNEARAALVDAGWDVSKYNGDSDTIEISW